MPFLDSLDIANQTCMFLGAALILTTDEDSVQNTAITFVYDKVRAAELRRNFWKFAIRRVALRPLDTTTKIITPDLWDATVTYLPGSIVRDANGLFWTSYLPGNINNQPEITTAWERYFGPMSVSLYDSTTTYFAGELVYVAGTDPGSYVVFGSLISSNADNPAVATAYDATVTYQMDDVVSFGGQQWRSLIELNLNISPVEGPLPWDSTAIYFTSDTVTGSDGFKYTAISGSQGFDPVSNPARWTKSTVATAWTAVPTQYTASLTWRPIYCRMDSLRMVYPLGSGPLCQASSRNVYRLPAGFLREAPQNPKAGSHSPLGFPSNDQYRDWDYEGDFIVTTDAYPIVYRFVADVTDVSKMDAMFCDGLACRIGIATASKITQSDGAVQKCAGLYKNFMGEARLANALEIGSTEAPIDDYISCRS